MIYSAIKVARRTLTISKTKLGQHLSNSMTENNSLPRVLFNSAHHENSEKPSPKNLTRKSYPKNPTQKTLTDPLSPFSLKWNGRHLFLGKLVFQKTLSHAKFGQVLFGGDIKGRDLILSHEVGIHLCSQDLPFHPKPAMVTPPFTIMTYSSQLGIAVNLKSVVVEAQGSHVPTKSSLFPFLNAPISVAIPDVRVLHSGLQVGEEFEMHKEMINDHVMGIKQPYLEDSNPIVSPLFMDVEDGGDIEACKYLMETYPGSIRLLQEGEDSTKIPEGQIVIGSGVFAESSGYENLTYLNYSIKTNLSLDDAGDKVQTKKIFAEGQEVVGGMEVHQ